MNSTRGTFLRHPSRILIPLVLFIFSNAHALPELIPVTQAQTQPAQAELIEIERKISQGILGFEETQMIRDFAQERGRKAFLFGGSASTVAVLLIYHSEFKPDQPKRTLSKFFRETQDLDVIYDGPTSEAIQLENELNRLFPYKHRRDPIDPVLSPAWEVRPLRERIGPKPYLIDRKGTVEPGFLLQNTDTLSTGLIEITDPLPQSDRVNDLRYFDQKIKLSQLDPDQSPNFLGDLFRKKVTFIHSPRHMETEMARRGRNPEILGILRTLTKVAQTGFELDSNSLDKFREILNFFDSYRDLNDPVGRMKVIQQTRKMIASSASPLKMIKILDEIRVNDDMSLRKLLIRLDPFDEPWSMKWVLSDQSPFISSEAPPISPFLEVNNPISRKPFYSSNAPSCMDVFSEVESVTSILSMSHPKERVEKIQTLNWNTLTPAEKNIILTKAPETTNSYEISALIDMAVNSRDHRWLPVLDRWISMFSSFSHGWQLKIRNKAQESFNKIQSFPSSQEIL